MVSAVGISQLGCTDLLFVDPGWALRSAALTTAMCSCQSSYYPWCARYIKGIFRLSTGQRPSCTSARDTVRLLLCCYRIFGQQTALTLIRLITGSGASSNSECTSRGFTTLTNWNNVCSKCGVTSTRASLTMQLASGASVFVHACRRTADTWSICCRNNTPVSIQPYDNTNVSFLSTTTRLLIFFYCNLQYIWTINFPKVVLKHT